MPKEVTLPLNVLLESISSAMGIISPYAYAHRIQLTDDAIILGYRYGGADKTIYISRATGQIPRKGSELNA